MPTACSGANAGSRMTGIFTLGRAHGMASFCGHRVFLSFPHSFSFHGPSALRSCFPPSFVVAAVVVVILIRTFAYQHIVSVIIVRSFVVRPSCSLCPSVRHGVRFTIVILTDCCFCRFS